MPTISFTRFRKPAQTPLRPWFTADFDRFSVAFLALTLGSAFTAGAQHKIQVSEPALAAQIEAQGGRLIADYGAYRLYETPVIQQRPAARLEVRDEYNAILLNAKRLDTTTPEVKAMTRPAGAFAGKKMHLVHFRGPIRPDWRDQLLATGVQIVDYIPQNAYLVYGDASSLGHLQALAGSAPQVQWEGPYQDEFKFHPKARPTDEHGNSRDIGTDRFAIQMVLDEEANASTASLIDSMKLAMVDHQFDILHYRTVVVRLPAARLKEIAARPDVISIRAYVTPRKYDERQDQIIAGNLTGSSPSGPGYLAWLASKGFNQAQFTASGFAADVSDSGLDNGTTAPGHFGLYPLSDTSQVSRVIYNRLVGRANPGSTLQGCDGHGTLNSHVIAGYDNTNGFPHTDTGGYHWGLGVCPFVKVGSSVIFDPEFFTGPNYSSLQSQAYNNGARVSNNSWGADVQGDYNSDSQAYDALVRSAGTSTTNREMVIVFAAGNAGPGAQTIGSPGTAKNVITVGASENVLSLTPANGGNDPNGRDGCGESDNGADNANDMASFSSRGPCTDGRMKPDIVAPGTHVTGGVAQKSPPPSQASTGSALSCFDSTGVCALIGSGTPGDPDNFVPLGQQFYTISTGTSHSSPAVVGGCALLRQYFINTVSNPPSPAMTKAYLMNSARYLTGSGANDTLWSKSQGMGEMNLGAAFDDAGRLLRDEVPSDMFTASGQTRVFNGVVGDPTRPFRVTIAWTDAPGSTTGKALKNDLDLTVTVGANTYKGNMFSGANSTTGGAADTLNNVESVFLPAGTTGNFQVTVTASSINSIGVPNSTNALLQDFALVIYNMGVPPSVSSQPASQTAFQGDSTAFSVASLGSSPFIYRWQLNGAPISGATNSTLVLTNVSPIQAGLYSVVVSNAFGYTVSSNATLSVIPTVPLPVALNATQLVWTSAGDGNWHGLTNVTHDGVAAGESAPLTNNQTSRLNTTLVGPGTLTFWWKVSSQTNDDFLTFSIGGVGQTNISGEVDWQQLTYYLAAGTQSLQWAYSKDASGSSGHDGGWVDQVSYLVGPTAALILNQPADQYVLLGDPATFRVSGGGTPSLQYQWQFNNAPISGATNPVLSLAQVFQTNSGNYLVVVSNAYGRVTSSNAALVILPVAVGGNNDFGQIDLLAGMTNAIAIAAGGFHSLTLRADGTVFAWGDDYDGQCDVPADLTNVVSIAGGGYHSVAARADGTVAAWGANYYGQTDVPAGLSGVISVAAGAWHNLALRTNGTVMAWGDNSSGQTDVPAGLSHVVAVAAGGQHSLALQDDGTVVAWGSNLAADGSYGGQATVPVGLTGVQAIAAGDFHSLALRFDGSIVGWGDNSSGQITVPLTNAVAIAAGGAHSIAINRSGGLVAWGDNLYNQSVVGNYQTPASEVGAGSYHTLALLARAPAAPVSLNPVRQGQAFQVSVQTVRGKAYFLQSRSSLTAGTWSSVIGASGNGGTRALTDPAASAQVRFYRIRQQ